MTNTTSQNGYAASQARNAVDKTADIWTQGAQGLTDRIPRLPQIDLIPAVERYFDFVQRTVDINRYLAVKWVEAAGTLTGVVRDQAELAADVVRDARIGRPHRARAGRQGRAGRPRAGRAGRARARTSGPQGRTEQPGRPMTRPASATRA